jgi:hypothetical protein
VQRGEVGVAPARVGVAPDPAQPAHKRWAHKS